MSSKLDVRHSSILFVLAGALALGGCASTTSSAHADAADRVFALHDGPVSRMSFASGSGGMEVKTASLTPIETPVSRRHDEIGGSALRTRAGVPSR